jgi:hypothetical protein
VAEERFDLRDSMQRRAAVQRLTEPAQAADLAGESLRWLNHLLGRLSSAADCYTVVASLAYCLERLPQALEGLTEYLGRQESAGRLRRADGGAAMERVALAEVAIEEALVSVAAAAHELRQAHNALADVYGPIREGDDGDR